MTTQKQRIAEALQVLEQLGMPREQLNDRTAICLLALLNVPPEKEWSQSEQPMIGIRAILDFAREKLNVNYAENTRESVRKYSVKQLVAAGVLLHNPDKPDRSVNSSDNCYQVATTALELFKTFGTKNWEPTLYAYLELHQTLADQYAHARNMKRIPVRVKEDKEITLSAGQHSDLIRAIIEDFGSNYVPGGELVYVGDTGAKWGYFDNGLLDSLGVQVGQHGKMPDVIIYNRERNCG
jgi:type II restriction enzyme